MKISKKRKGFGLEVKTIVGSKGTYLFFHERNGAYHTFLEVAAKDAARDCGGRGSWVVKSGGDYPYRAARRRPLTSRSMKRLKSRSVRPTSPLRP